MALKKMEDNDDYIFRTHFNKKIREYVNNWSNKKYQFHDSVPMFDTVAVILGVSRRAVFLWYKDGDHPEFTHQCELLKSMQARVLVNGGLAGKLNTTITKILLTDHEYSVVNEESVVSTDTGVGAKLNITVEHIATKPQG